MKPDAPVAEVNIHLRARAQDRDLIDQAADLVGTNRSQFMLVSALKEARNVLLDQTTFHLDSATFQRVLDILDAPPSPEQKAGLARLRAARRLWPEGRD